MPKTITGSANISILDSKIIADICVGKFFIDISTSVFIGSGANNVLGARVKVTNPLGVDIMPYRTLGYDITNGAGITGDVEVVIPTEAGNYQYGTYLIEVSLYDAGGAIHVLSKPVKISHPDANNKTKKYGCISATINGLCRDGKASILVNNPPVYLNKMAEDTVQSFSLQFPTGTLEPIASTVRSFSAVLFEGVYKLTGEVCASYNFGDNVFVDVPYKVNYEKKISCIINTEELSAWFDGKHQQLDGECTEQQRFDTSYAVMDAVRLLKTAELALEAGHDASEYITQLEELTGCNCACQTNEGVPISNNTPTTDFLITGCNVTSSVNGLTTTYTINNYNYIVSINPQSSFITASAPAIVNCTKTIQLAFNISSFLLQVYGTYGGVINIKLLEVYGDGETDDSNAIETALNTYPNIHFPEGEYIVNRKLLIDDVEGLNVVGNKALLKSSITTRFEGAYLAFEDCSNISVLGLSFDMNKSSLPIYSGADYGTWYNQGISFYHCSNISVMKCKFSNLYNRSISVYQCTGKADVLDNFFESPVQSQGHVAEHVYFVTFDGKANVSHNEFINAAYSDPQYGICNIIVANTTGSFLIDDNYMVNSGRNNTHNHRACAIDFYSDSENVTATNNRLFGVMAQAMRSKNGRNVKFDTNRIDVIAAGIDPIIEISITDATLETDGTIIHNNEVTTEIPNLFAIELVSAGSPGQQIKNTKISKNTLKKFSKGIWIVNGVYNLVIDDNIFEECGIGVSMESATDNLSKVENVIISKSTINNLGTGIYLGYNNLVEGSVIKNIILKGNIINGLNDDFFGITTIGDKLDNEVIIMNNRLKRGNIALYLRSAIIHYVFNNTIDDFTLPEFEGGWQESVTFENYYNGVSLGAKSLTFGNRNIIVADGEEIGRIDFSTIDPSGDSADNIAASLKVVSDAGGFGISQSFEIWLRRGHVSIPLRKLITVSSDGNVIIEGTVDDAGFANKRTGIVFHQSNAGSDFNTAEISTNPGADFGAPKMFLSVLNLSSGLMEDRIEIGEDYSRLLSVSTYADNAAAVADGRSVGTFYYRTGHGLDIVI